MTAKLRVVVFGFGFSAQTLHVPLIQATPDLSLAGIVTRSNQRHMEASSLSSHIRVFPSEEHFWSSAETYDLAVIATVNRSHFSLATQLLEHGLHLVIDKPVTGNSADAEVLLHLSQALAKQVHVFQNRRWDSDFLTLRGLYESGEAGEGLLLDSRMESRRKLVRESWRNSRDPLDLGGVILDLGSHLVDQALQIMGPVRSVFCTAQAVRDSGIAEDYAHIAMTHAHQGVSHLTMSRASDPAGPRFTLLGRGGSIEIRHTDTQELLLRRGKDPSSMEWGYESEEAYADVKSWRILGPETDRRCPFVPGEWPTFYKKVAKSISSGHPAPVNFEDVVSNLRVLDGARQSAISHDVIRFETPVGHSPQ